jgi:YfiH family protein
VLEWDVSEGVPLLRWGRVPGILAAFSGRVGGVSTGAWESLNLGLRSQDDLARVCENRDRLCAAAGADPARTSSCRQRHSAVVHVVDADPERAFTDQSVQSPDGDGLVTSRGGRALVVFAADCVPVVVARTDGSRVGVCHAGWRGLLDGVVEELAAEVGGPAAAAVGPCAGPAAYEVGPDVSQPLAERFGPSVVDGRYADLAGCARIALERSGVGSVDVAGLCTITDAARFFSHRRDGEPSGRQGLIAYRDGHARS